jgi:hypothetical protein
LYYTYIKHVQHVAYNSNFSECQCIPNLAWSSWSP